MPARFQTVHTAAKFLLCGLNCSLVEFPFDLSYVVGEGAQQIIFRLAPSEIQRQIVRRLVGGEIPQG